MKTSCCVKQLEEESDNSKDAGRQRESTHNICDTDEVVVFANISIGYPLD